MLYCIMIVSCGEPAVEPQCGHEETGTVERVGFITREEVFFLVQTGEVADKYCNAKMLMRFEWEDPELAKSEWQPPVEFNFEGGFGYFTPEIVRKGNAANGYYYEASAESAVSGPIRNPIDYYITSDYIYYPNRPQGAVKLTGKIEYKIFNPLKY
jgi:hypothetical protein